QGDRRRVSRQRRRDPGAVRPGARRDAADARHRSGPPRADRRGRARARRSESRCEDQDARRHPRAAAAGRRPRREPRAAFPPGALIGALSAAYGAAAGWRRAWYARDPSRQKRLARPVVSVGNLRVGGSGKTPIVDYLARMLTESGERPAILTRGYARRVARDGVTIVSDGTHVVADLDTAGDEPLMLARALPGVPVLVGADRYLSGTLAERRLGATVHLLDDGFQHLELAREVDLLLVSEDDLTDRPMPAGRLRERLDAASAADAALVTAGYESAAERIGRAIGISPVFRVARGIAAPRRIDGERESVV